MALTIVLDTSPLSIVTKRRGLEEADACCKWIMECKDAGHRILAPVVAYYEVARELTRIDNQFAWARLNHFCEVPGCCLPLEDSAIRLGVNLWAKARNKGLATADPKELDCDVLIVAQALILGIIML